MHRREFIGTLAGGAVTAAVLRRSIASECLAERRVDLSMQLSQND
jgi:hypothetical protein